VQRIDERPPLLYSDRGFEPMVDHLELRPAFI